MLEGEVQANGNHFHCSQHEIVLEVLASHGAPGSWRLKYGVVI